jgi:hypothetical protein
VVRANLRRAEGGAIPVDKLVTATFDLSAAVEAFVVARQREQVKAHLTVS